MNQKSWGGAISAAGRINIGTLDNIRFTFNYGNVSPYVDWRHMPMLP
ncbi:MAG: hypothetical protein IPH22_13020 [Nitrosomonas sp.]|nr:hypothetical protein [Nitrosomonas sp.]